MSDTYEQIHEGVRERYGKFARESSSCCGDVSSTVSCGTYDIEVLENVPGDIANLSLGCGDPVTIAGFKAGETVLDLGSGAGLDCFLAAQQVGETGRVIGLDMTQDMLDKANANKARLKADNVEFRYGYIEKMPVDDDSIDIIMSNCVINLSPDKGAVFNESFRVLKPGGRVSISDIVTDGQFSEELRADMDQWAECVTGAIPAEDYTGLMRQAGFVDIEVVDKADAEGIVTLREGMPHVYSARITARKPV